MNHHRAVDSNCSFGFADVGSRASLFGLRDSAEAYLLRDFLTRCGSQFDWVELSSDEEAQNLAGLSGLQDPRLPVYQPAQGPTLFKPSTRDLARALAWFCEPKHEIYDLAIYGAGPAGLSAAVYGASEGLRTIVIERSAIGGQASSTSRIENYLGFPDGVSGSELTHRAWKQAQRLGAEFIIADAGISGEIRSDLIVGLLASGRQIVSKAAITATGVDYKTLGILNEERFLNHGLFYGAGASEVKLCCEHVFIVGGGNSAGQAALHFAGRANKVTMLVRGKSLEATLSAYLVARIRGTSNIETLTDSTIEALSGSDRLEEITYRARQTGRLITVPARQVFVCIGGKPRTDWARPETLCLDRAGYIITGDDLAGASLPAELWRSGRKPLFMESSIPGNFVAGDVRHNSIKRCATAVGEGASAVSMVHKYLTKVLSTTTAQRIARQLEIKVNPDPHPQGIGLSQ